MLILLNDIIYIAPHCYLKTSCVLVSVKEKQPLIDFTSSFHFGGAYFASLTSKSKKICSPSITNKGNKGNNKKNIVKSMS